MCSVNGTIAHKGIIPFKKLEQGLGVVSCFQSHANVNWVLSYFLPDFLTCFKGNYFSFSVGQQEKKQDLNLFWCPKADRFEDNFFLSVVFFIGLVL